MMIYQINHEPFSYNIYENGVVCQFVIGQDDRTGENITDQNLLLEGRFMYWAWKNAKDDYIGLQYRRRYLYFPDMLKGVNGFRDLTFRAEISKDWQLRCTTSRFQRYVIELSKRPADEFEWIKKYDLITSIPEHYPGISIIEQYGISHDAKDWGIFEQIMIEEGFTREHMTMQYLYTSNIWVMRWEVFDIYMKLWWRVMQKLVTRITPNLNDSYQQRVFGFLTERLFTIWFTRMSFQFRQKHFPILFGELSEDTVVKEDGTTALRR